MRGRGFPTASPGALRTPMMLARQPLIGLLMVIAGGLAFSLFASSLQSQGALTRLDVPLANALHRAALGGLPLVRGLMLFGFYLGEHVIFVIGVGLGLYFLKNRFWPELFMIIIAWAGEGLLWIILSSTFNRPRPVFDVPVWHVMTSPGFPSGHAISAVMCYGLLAYLWLPHVKAPISKALVVLASLAAVLLVGYSRLYIGDHYLSDVLAGFALGIAWSGLVYTSVELIYSKRMKQDVKEQETNREVDR